MSNVTKVRENGQVTANAGFGTLVPSEERLIELCRSITEGVVVVTMSGRRPTKGVVANTVVKLQEVIKS